MKAISLFFLLPIIFSLPPILNNKVPYYQEKLASNVELYKFKDVLGINYPDNLYIVYINFKDAKLSLSPMINEYVKPIPKVSGKPLLAFNTGFFSGNSNLSIMKNGDKTYYWDITDPNKPFIITRKTLCWNTTPEFSFTTGNNIKHCYYAMQGMSVNLADRGSITDGPTSRTFIYVKNKYELYIMVGDNALTFNTIVKIVAQLGGSEKDIINYDGGGSSTLKIWRNDKWEVLNYLRDGGERAIKTYMVLYKNP